MQEEVKAWVGVGVGARVGARVAGEEEGKEAMEVVRDSEALEEKEEQKGLGGTLEGNLAVMERWR